MSLADISVVPASGEAELSLYASWGRRFAAWLIDGVLVWIASGIASAVLHPRSLVALVPLLLVVPAVYYTLCHGGPSGQTLGKRMLGIAVRDHASLGRLGFPRAFGRWAITLFFWCLFAIGGVLDGLWALGNARHRTWHDKIAGSVVVRV